MQTACSMANKVTTVVVLVLSCILVLTDARNLAESYPHPKDIFILAGQSNMAGRAALKWNTSIGEHGANVFVPSMVPAEDQPDPERIFRLNAQLGWEVAKDPLHVDVDRKPAGVGPGMSFANAIKGQVGTIGLVPCAVGETSISMWQRGGELYNNMIKRTKVAVQDGGKIKALLWYQGEYDSSNWDLVNAYKGNLEMFFQNLREDLNFPSLPIIQVALATVETNGNEIKSSAEASGAYDDSLTTWDAIRRIQKSIDLPNVVTVDGKGLPHNGKPDEVHLSEQGQVILGNMLAKAYLDNFLSSP